MKPILITITHDPDAKILPLLSDTFREITGLFDGVVSEITQISDPRTRAFLARFGYVGTQYTSGIDKARRAVLRNALDMTSGSRLFYCDLDRLIHWYINYPDELRQAVELNGSDLIIYGRTDRALSSHPQLQRETETQANNLFSAKFGQPYDVLAATRGLSRWLAGVISSQSQAIGPAGVDAEWPLIAQTNGFTVGYMACEGLEYESDTFGIRRNGGDEARLRFQNVKDLQTICGK